MQHPDGHRFDVVYATGEDVLFPPGSRVRIVTRSPIGHYRVPIYLRGKVATVESVMEPVAIDNEEEGFGRDAGLKRHYYRVSVPMSALWSDYVGFARDALHIEVFESWLEAET